MGSKKIGRPTDNPKNVSFNIRLDEESEQILNEYLNRHPEIKRSEAIRIGIKLLANEK